MNAIKLFVKSEKQHDAALQDLRALGLEQAVVGYNAATDGCSNGTLDDQQLEQTDVYVASTSKEFIQEVKKYLV